MMNLESIERAVGEARGYPFTLASCGAVTGGSINQAFSLVGDDGSRYFAKLNTRQRRAMFEAEEEGLRAIIATGTVRAPQPLVVGEGDGHSFIVIEMLELRSAARDTSERRLGERLATMHRHMRDAFGFTINNTIGSTPQSNDWDSDWLSFWRDQRLGYQLELARQRGASARLLRQGERLMDSFPTLFEDYCPVPSLLHGDLWGGNWAVDTDGEPVIFDPACYYGDREADIAMTELFGGFGKAFYDAYQSAWPLDPGYRRRKGLYNLYHILNHFNLFGGGYASQAEHMIDSMLAGLHRGYRD